MNTIFDVTPFKQWQGYVKEIHNLYLLLGHLSKNEVDISAIVNNLSCTTINHLSKGIFTTTSSNKFCIRMINVANIYTHLLWISVFNVCLSIKK